MVCVASEGINRTACMGCQTASYSRLGVSCELFKSWSLPDGTALLFASKWLLSPPFSSLPTHLLLPTHAPSIDKTHDIIRIEILPKNQLQEHSKGNISYIRM